MTYYRPETLEKALEILKNEGENLLIIAGCTDVGVEKQEGRLKKDSFLDISYIQSLKNIEKSGEYITLGALCTHSDISNSPLIKKEASILSQACSTVGSPQIRNRGTLGGNISHASPSADSIPAIMTLKGEILLKNSQNEHWIPATDYFTGPGKTVRKPDEILVAVRFCPINEYFSLFQKLGQRKSLACSKASVAFAAKIAGGNLSDVRIAMGAVGPTVIYGKKSAEFLEGKKINEDLINKAAEILSSEATPIDDLRSTAEYRRKMMGVLLEKALKKAAASS